MLYGIKIDSEYFDMNKPDEAKRMFAYCEQRFEFRGDEWERIKMDFDYDEMGELVKNKGVNYQEFIE